MVMPVTNSSADAYSPQEYLKRGNDRQGAV
jgi:hypothetical protein